MNKIPRKPIAQPGSGLDSNSRLESSPEKQPPLPKIPAENTEDLKQRIPDSDPLEPVISRQNTSISAISNTPISDVQGTSHSKWKSMLEDTVYFAGGLVSHPFESTKHFTVLRHSTALVYYKGPSTRLVVSVFGDLPLPADRTFWLQRKGFTGNMGMAASAFMRTSMNWIDVTPSVQVESSSLPKADERAWDRDIRRFHKKTSKDRRLVKHKVLETCVLRVPAEAADGYLRVVMCTGETTKKTLCPSPTFRLASTSTDAGIVRGASLRTLPLEAGIKVASFVGNSYVQGVIGTAQAVMQDKWEQMKPAFIANNAGAVALAQDELTTYDEEHFDAETDVLYDPFHEEGVVDKPPEVIGSDEGPEDPFPIQLRGRVVPGTGKYKVTPNGNPTANMSGVADELLHRLGGVYIGWAAIEPGKASESLSQDWHEAIVTIGPSPYAAPSVAAKKVATVHVIHDFGEGITFFNSKLKVMIMTFLRPVARQNLSTPPLDMSASDNRDKSVAITSLSREMWQYDVAIDILAQRNDISTGEKYTAFRSNMQRRVDSIPLHLAGVRTERSELRDQIHGRGGFYVRR